MKTIDLKHGHMHSNEKGSDDDNIIDENRNETSRMMIQKEGGDKDKDAGVSHANHHHGDNHIHIHSFW